jgi:drug/metabolite transporter (DMT)-like permease
VNSSTRSAFIGLAAIWGASFLFIKVGVDHGVPPVLVAFTRVAIGALVLLAVVRTRLPRGRVVNGHLFFVALVMNTLPFTLFAYGEQHVSSVLAGIYNATTPLLTLVAVLLFLPSERPTPRKLVGLGVGFFGVLVVLGPWHSLGGSELGGQLMCLAAAACYGVGATYMRRFLAGRPESGPELAASQLAWGTLQLLIVSLVVGDTPHGVTTGAVLSMLALGALGSGVAYILFFKLIREAGATSATSVTYLIPIFSTALGVVVLGETLTWNEPVGAVIVLAAVWFASLSGTRVRRRRRQEAVTQEAYAR